MANNENGESVTPDKDEHGCTIGKERWDEEKQQCVPIETPPTELAIEEVLAENITLKRKVADQLKTIDALTEQLKAANDVLEAQTKAKLISEILPKSTFTIEDLAAKTLNQLHNIRATLDQARYPTFKTIRPGPVAADEQKDQGLTVGDLSIPTAEKRRAAAERRA